MIPVGEPHLRVSTYSHAGAGGEQNEDRYAVQGYELNDVAGTGSVFAIVADGVGDQRAGERAAEIAVHTILQSVGQSDASQPTAILQAAIIQASQTILAQSESQPELAGMGSTCLCAWVVGRRLYMASVGNSRLYLLRKNTLQQLNMAYELEQEDEKSPKGKAKHEARRGYIGGRKALDIDMRLVLRRGSERNAERNQGARLEPNDRLLLCSDGLSDALSEAEIIEMLGGHRIEFAAEALVNAALKKGAPGNLTALVLGVPPARPTPTTRRMRLRKVLVLSMATVTLLVISLLGWYFWGQWLDAGGGPRPTPIATLTAQPAPTSQPTLAAE